MFSRVRIVIAALYWVFVLFVFVGLKYADPGWAEGGTPLVVVSLPWSIPVLFIAGGMAMLSGVGHALATEAGNFFLFVILCGGLNAVLILGASKVWHLLRSNARLRMIGAVAIAGLVASAQLIMPSVDRNALERSRPRDVPKDAVHVGDAIGWWQHCTYDAARDVDRCSIWNRGGLLLESGEFVSYDGMSTARSEELDITDFQSGPDRISLRDGRVLIPKDREAEMKRFLDGLIGPPQTR